MTTPVFCSSTGSNTSPYETWAKAATTFATAVAQASSSGDVIAVDATNPPADVAAATTWTFAANVSVIASTNSGTATITPTTMGATTWLGSSGATSYPLTLNGAFKVYFYGITLRVAGGTNQSISLNTSEGNFDFEDCYLWQGSTNGSPRILAGASTSGGNSYTRFKNTTLRFGSTGHSLGLSQRCVLEQCSVSSAGSAPSSLFGTANATVDIDVLGCDLSQITSTLVASQAGSSARYNFVQCKFGSGVTPMGVQAVTSKASAQVWVLDCHDGDTHGMFGYYDAFGSVGSITGTKLTASAAGQSWEIVTTANCGFGTPFVTPWINWYNSGTSAITPKLELLRNNGTATAYNNAQVWGEFSVKDNAGFTNATIYTDRQALVDWAAGTSGAAQTAGVGTGSWTIGASNSPASFVVDSGASVTPDEVGDIRARVCVAIPSISALYVDPFIRT